MLGLFLFNIHIKISMVCILLASVISIHYSYISGNEHPLVEIAVTIVFYLLLCVAFGLSIVAVFTAWPYLDTHTVFDPPRRFLMVILIWALCLLISPFAFTGPFAVLRGVGRAIGYMWRSSADPTLYGILGTIYLEIFLYWSAGVFDLVFEFNESLGEKLEQTFESHYDHIMDRMKPGIAHSQIYILGTLSIAISVAIALYFSLFIAVELLYNDIISSLRNYYVSIGVLAIGITLSGIVSELRYSDGTMTNGPEEEIEGKPNRSDGTAANQVSRTESFNTNDYGEIIEERD